MKREDKKIIVEDLKEKIKEYPHFYFTDTLGLDAVDTFNLRKECFENDIKLIVCKNTLLKWALKDSEKDYDEILDALKGPTAVMFTQTGNKPGKVIKKLRKKLDKPILKAAFVEESVYFGDDKLEALAALKSKEELIGDIINILQSPAKNVISALQSSGNKLAGVLKTLSEKE